MDNVSTRNRNLALVFQSFALFPHMNVYKNVEFGLRMHRIEPDERRKRVIETLKRENGEGEQAVMPPEGLTPGAPPPGSGGFAGGPGFNAVNQTMLKEGEPTNRILLQQPLSNEPEA